MPGVVADELAEIEALAAQVEHHDKIEVPEEAPASEVEKRNAKVESLKRHLRNKTSPYSKYSDTYSSELQNAIICRDESTVHLILMTSVEEVDRRSLVDGTYPIHHAVVTGRLSMVKIIVEAKADINAKSHDGVTCLHKVISLT